MSDWIEHEGKKYYEESYLILANNNAGRARMETARRCAEIAEAAFPEGCKSWRVASAACREVAYDIRREFGLLDTALHGPHATNPDGVGGDGAKTTSES